MTKEQMINDIVIWCPDVARSYWESKSMSVVKANWLLMSRREANEADEVNAAAF